MQKGLAKKRPGPHWTEKFFKIEDLGPEPPLNREGFWKKRKPDEVEIELSDEHNRSGMEKPRGKKLR